MFELLLSYRLTLDLSKYAAGTLFLQTCLYSVFLRIAPAIFSYRLTSTIKGNFRVSGFNPICLSILNYQT